MNIVREDFQPIPIHHSEFLVKIIEAMDENASKRP